ncbi:Hypothetical predicted protein [Octopus vulgaris]|uniref:Uncharacterized protein n=1 Tax=Octopus vulgaris TaxID=6645 RepID=A0AA36APC5_OCTVU|nr:Hypothetical predicted protein [Octopus vulgaris]
MCESLLRHYQNDSQLLENLWFSDVSLFHHSGRVNRHNCRIWGKSKPTEILEHERDSPKLVVWYSMSRSGLIGPFFFRDTSGNPTAVTGENYLVILHKSLLTFNNVSLENLEKIENNALNTITEQMSDAFIIAVE